VTVALPPNHGRDEFDLHMPEDELMNLAHVPSVDVTVDDLLVNKTMTRALFKPDTATNSWVHTPEEYAHLLPYVTEDTILENTVVEQSQSVTLGWTNEYGEDQTAPVANRPFIYYPRVLGNMFIGDNETSTSEQVYETCAIPEKPVIVAAADCAPLGKEMICQLCTRAQLDALKTARPYPVNAINVVGDIAPQVVELAHKSDGVYRSDLSQMFLVVSAAFLESATEAQARPSTGFFAFPLEFNLQLTFGTDGKAITRAVSFDGIDVTDQVLMGDFLRMQLKVAEEEGTVHGLGLETYALDGGGVLLPVAPAQEAKPGLSDVDAFRVALFLPRRRYTFTDRVANDPVAESNLPENTSGLVNHAVAKLKPSSDILVAVNAPGFAQEFGFRESNELWGLHTSLTTIVPAEEQFPGVFTWEPVIGAGGLTPFYTEAVGVRHLAGFEVLGATEVATKIGRLTVNFPNQWHMIRARRTHRFTYQGAAANRHVKTSQGPDDDSNLRRGWHPNGAAENAGSVIVTEAAVSYIYMFFQSGTVNTVVGPPAMLQFGAGSYMVFSTGGEYNAATLALLTADGDAPRLEAYQSSSTNRVYLPGWDRPGPVFRPLVDIDPTLILNPAFRLGAERTMENGYLTSVVDPFFDHVIAGNQGNAIRDAINEVLTCDAIHMPTIENDRIYENLIGDKAIRRQCKGTIQLEEPLLTLRGASNFIPSHIFQKMDYYPPIIQDFKFQVESTKPFVKRENCTTIDKAVCIFKPTLNTNFKLGTYSKNTFRQEDKSLQRVDISLCDIQRFEVEFERTAGATYEVPFSTVRGPPQYVFVRVERQSTEMQAYSDYPIQITGLAIESVDQDVQSLSCMSEYRLQRATVRNSNIRADAEKNRRLVGGVLLSVEDLCRWTDFDFYQERDVLSGSFLIKEEQLRDWPNIASSIDARVQTLLKEQDIRVRVGFVYNDFKLEGEAGTMEFKYPPQRMSKLFMIK
jgi:hypothetical protein